jgi:hypothetical protein
MFKQYILHMSFLTPNKWVQCNGHMMHEVGSSCGVQTVRHIATGPTAVGLKVE